MSKIKCPNCGNELDENMLFCEACGTSISKEQNYRMVRKNHNRERLKSDRSIDGSSIIPIIGFSVLFFLSVLFIAFGIFMAVIGAKVWLVIVIFVASIVCFGLGFFNLKQFLKNR